MSNLYKDLLFLHGHVTNPFVLEPKLQPAPQPKEPTAQTPVVVATTDDTGEATAARRRGESELRKCA